MPIEISVALIGLLGVIISALLGYYAVLKQKNERLLLENELQEQIQSLDFAFFSTHWNELYWDIKELLETTSICRFLILRAWNGKLSPRWTTSIFQMRRGKQKPINYIHFELDSDHVNRLRTVVDKKHALYIVDEMPNDSEMKNVYRMENIKESMWSLIEETKIGDDSCAITYCSMSSTESIDQNTQTKCKMLVNKLQGFAAKLKQSE